MKMTFTEWCSALNHGTSVQDKERGGWVNISYYVKLKSVDEKFAKQFDKPILRFLFGIEP